ncbi:receptor-like protein kinase FERONIA [Tanacetum coccineum]
MMDAQRKLKYPREGAYECFDLALRCVAKYSKDKPSSEEVLQKPDKYDCPHYDSSDDLLNNQFDHLEKLNSGHQFFVSPLSTQNTNQKTVVSALNLDKVIERGGFGKDYRGTIFNGSATVLDAIKRLDPSSNQGAPKFWVEVEMLSKFQHYNLVSLFGDCNHEKEMILVYEYMPNGTLEDHLHKLGTSLSWIQRLKICIGAAYILHYLHTDFGLSKISPINQPSTGVNTVVRGTFGYLDPDYYATGKLTRKSDVYAFGVVLLEALCRKQAVFDIDKQTFNLRIWARESIKVGNLKKANGLKMHQNPYTVNVYQPVLLHVQNGHINKCFNISQDSRQCFDCCLVFPTFFGGLLNLASLMQLVVVVLVVLELVLDLVVELVLALSPELVFEFAPVELGLS